MTTYFSPLLPGATVGVLGGGQLGRFFALAAKTMGYRVVVWDPDSEAPSATVADHFICAPFNDELAQRQMIAMCDAITLENENIAADVLTTIADQKRLCPSPQAVSICQHRVREKSFINDCGIATVPWIVIDRTTDFDHVDHTLLPGILKTAEFGYDGKGQRRVKTIAELRKAYQELGAETCVLEKMVDLDFEISVVLARSDTGDSRAFPPAWNEHENGILWVSTAPAPMPDDLLQAAQETANKLAAQMRYVGVLAVEFFVTKDKQLLVNEMAPRPHNSGHYTLNGCVTSQFEQQLRALTGLPLGNTVQWRAASMVNLLGDDWLARGQMPDWQHLLQHDNVHLHIYGKKDVRAGRKLAHFTVTAETASMARAQAQKLYATITAKAPIQNAGQVQA